MRATGGILAALFLGAASAADADPAIDPAPEAVLASLPFEKGAPARTIVIDLAPKGNARRLRFQLDTGATNSVVTPRLAREMGVKVSRIKQDAYRRGTVLGRDVQFYVDTNRSDTGSTSGWEFGLVGGDFLSDYVVELDFAGKRVRFLEPRLFEVRASVDAPGEAVFPMKLVSSRPALRALLDGHAVDLLVDTGAYMGLMLSGEIARNVGLAFAPVPDFELLGTRGRTAGHAGDLARLTLGPFVFEQVPAVVSPNGFFNLGFPGDSILGYDVLAQFLVRIDYPRQRIWLRQRADAPPFFDPRRTAESRAGTP
ncbi:MAG TPA: aspartyl protease family protein [Myxococcota bacterium]|nr:aspartyl protease family protein [Myxococcota bacterium]